MTLKMLLRWKNPDASTDINLRFKDVFSKGFVTGAVITPVVAVLHEFLRVFRSIPVDNCYGAESGIPGSPCQPQHARIASGACEPRVDY